MAENKHRFARTDAAQTAGMIAQKGDMADKAYKSMARSQAFMAEQYLKLAEPDSKQNNSDVQSLSNQVTFIMYFLSMYVSK